MANRLNIQGFSVEALKALLGSGDEATAHRIVARLERDHPSIERELRLDAAAAIERAVVDGVPIPGLDQEDAAHALAARLLAEHEQDWVATDSGFYPAAILTRTLWDHARKVARTETKVFLDGLIIGVPLFGERAATDGSSYAILDVEKLRYFRSGLINLRSVVATRVARIPRTTSDDRAAANLATGFCRWIDQFLDLGLGLWCDLNGDGRPA